MCISCIPFLRQSYIPWPFFIRKRMRNRTKRKKFNKGNSILSDGEMFWVLLKHTIFREAFAIFDTNRTGCITSSDLTAVMRNLGQNPSEKDIQDMVNEIDADGNATIEFDEFLNMMEQKMRSVIPDETLYEAFNVFDKDGNGFISLEELRHVMNCLGVVLTKSEVQQMMDEADTDKDGQLNFREFAAMMN